MKFTLRVIFNDGSIYWFKGTAEEVAAKAFKWGIDSMHDDVTATEISVTPAKEN